MGEDFQTIAEKIVTKFYSKTISQQALNELTSFAWMESLVDDIEKSLNDAFYLGVTVGTQKAQVSAKSNL